MLGLMLAVVLVGDPVGDEAREKAEEAEFVAVGKKAFSQRRYAQAIAAFQAAYQAGKRTVRLYNIGKCYERLNETGKALQYYREYLRLEPSAGEDDLLLSELANARRRLGEAGKQQLVVFAIPEDAVVLVDEEPQASRPAYVDLPAGEHRFVVKAEGHETEERRIQTPLPGGDDALRFTLRPSKPPADAPQLERASRLAPAPEADLVARPALGPDGAPPLGSPARKRVVTWIAGGLAVAAGATAAGLGVAYGQANGTLHTFETGRQRPETTALEDRTVRLAVGTDVAAGVAGVALVAAVALYFFEAP